MGKKWIVGLLALLAPVVGGGQASGQVTPEEQTPPGPVTPGTTTDEATEDTTPITSDETEEPMAQTPAPPSPDYAPEDQSFLEEYGLSLSVGGGVTGFTDSQMRDTADVGGLWDVRVGILTNKWIGAEIAYLGGLQSIDALGLDTSAQLLSTTIEGDLRANLTQGRWNYQPYLFAGVAWRRYSLTNADVNLSSVEDQDDVMEIPLGVGIGFRMSGFLVDVRGSFRPTTGADLVPTGDGEDNEAMHSWQAAARLGYAF